ncbi:DUF2332 domain-containing protein [Actinophytocola glycyrrhizae]|uniref:DUF2332 domain-containing protein n=1 Tax=Actinophytocola glycyrrhizae TaxID=2044873 RepID=A0ABV9RUM5_9PSEU
MPTADRFRRFAETEARGESPCYEEWALGVAADREVIALLDALPEPKRQPNLVFTAARYTGVPAGRYPEFREALIAEWPTISEVLLARRTQTNEPGRCAVLLPLLAALPAPLALLEVGASAGLCLFPDRYAYRYDDRAVLGTSGVVLDCATTGPVPFPAALPEVVWRAGIDLNPLDIDDPEDVRWLETLIWPEHDHRRARLAAALEVVRAERPRIVTGDLNERVAALAAEAPRDATLVIFHSAVLAYLSPSERARFAATVRSLDAHWIANEGAGALPVTAPPSPRPGTAMFLVTIDSEPVAHAAGHGHTLHWLTRGTGRTTPGSPPP